MERTRRFCPPWPGMDSHLAGLHRGVPSTPRWNLKEHLCSSREERGGGFEGRSSREKPERAGVFSVQGRWSPGSGGRQSVAGRAGGPGWSCDPHSGSGHFSRGLSSGRAEIPGGKTTDAAGDWEL